MSGTDGTLMLLLVLALMFAGAITFTVIVLMIRISRRKKSQPPDKMDFVVGTFHELVGQLKQKEQELERLRLVAEERAGSMEVDIKALESQAELRETLSNLGEMSAGIAHELRNPMGVIAGNMRLLKKNAQPGDTQKVDAVIAEVGVMDRIIEDFLAFAKPGKPSRVELELGDFIDDTVHGTSCEHEIGIVVEVAPGIIFMADEVMLRQAVTNLIKNACEATSSYATSGKAAPAKDGYASGYATQIKGSEAAPIKGGEATAALQNIAPQSATQDDAAGVVLIRGYAEGDGAVITVTDSGPGFRDIYDRKVFMPFYSTKDKGTGLGLAVAHRNIAAHGGSVTISRASGGAYTGALVKIILPGAIRNIK